MMAPEHATLLRQLREAVARKAPVSVIPIRDTEAMVELLVALRTKNARAMHPAPLVESAARRLLEALQSRSLQGCHTRDVDALLTFLAARGRAA